MWFWSGQAVGEDEIGDVKAYNRANGIMWIVFSLLMWLSTFLAFSSMKLAGDLNEAMDMTDKGKTHKEIAKKL